MLSATVATPPGPFTLVVESESVIASGWAPNVDALLDAIGRRRLPELAAAAAGRKVRQVTDLGPFTQAVDAYLAGDFARIADVPVSLSGTPLQMRAWKELRTIAAGSTQCYAQVAARCDKPHAARAIGSACARNSAALFVPCHRVVRAAGAVGGFAYGAEVKRWLLEHERHLVARAVTS